MESSQAGPTPRARCYHRPTIPAFGGAMTLNNYPTLDRRSFLKTAAAAAAAAALPPFALAAPAPGSFDFAFFTDTHIEPELEAPHGCDLAFGKIAKLKP